MARNPECVGSYSFTQFVASAVCYMNPLKTGRYLGIMTKRQNALELCEVEIYSRGSETYKVKVKQIFTVMGVGGEVVEGGGQKGTLEYRGGESICSERREGGSDITQGGGGGEFRGGTITVRLRVRGTSSKKFTSPTPLPPFPHQLRVQQHAILF